MEFPAHIVFSCLLVCQPAIFVDSKRDGTGAAHGRKGFRMKRAELDRRIANGKRWTISFLRSWMTVPISRPTMT